jgi:hypothetical protein
MIIISNESFVGMKPEKLKGGGVQLFMHLVSLAVLL